MQTEHGPKASGGETPELTVLALERYRQPSLWYLLPLPVQ